MDEGRKNRKQRAVEEGRKLETIGLAQKNVALKLNLSKGYVSRIFNEYEPEFVPSTETLQRLEELVVEKARAIMQHIFEMSSVPVATVESCNGPSADVTRRSKKCLERMVVTALASAMAGQPQRIKLPKGISGVTIRVGEEPYSMLVIAVKAADDKSNKLTLAHEYEHIADHFRDKANELRGGGEPPELPNRWF